MKKVLVIVFLLNAYLEAQAIQVDKYSLLSLLRQTEFYITTDNDERATELCSQAMELFNSLGADNDQNTISELHNISHAYAEKKMYDKAVETESLLVEIFPLALPNNQLDYVLYLNDLSLYCLEGGKVTLAEQSVKKALSLIGNNEDVNLTSIYVRAAEVFEKTNPPRIDLSIEYQKKAVNIYANTFGKTDSLYLEELWYLAKYYEKAEDYGNACNTYLELFHTRTIIGRDTGSYCLLPLIDRIIYCSRKINDSEQEKKYKEIAFELTSQKQKKHQAMSNSVEFPCVKDSIEFLNISSHLMQLKESEDRGPGITIKDEIKNYIATLSDSYGKAYLLSFEAIRGSLAYNSKDVIEYGLEALRIYDNLNIITDKYVMVLCCIAAAYNELDNPAKAYDYIIKAYELRDKYLPSNNIYYNGILNDLALYCSRLGNYSDAIKYGILAVETKEPYVYTDNSLGYYLSLNNLASYYGEIGNIDTEINILQYLINRAEDVEPSVLDFPENPFLYNLASCYMQKGNWNRAIETGLRVKEIRENSGHELLCSNIYRLLAEAYFRNGELNEALRYANEVKNIQKGMGRDDDLLLCDIYHLLARIYNKYRKLETAEKMERYSMRLLYNNIINNFINLPSDDRTSYWNNYSRMFNVWYPNYFIKANLKDAGELYNKCALFAKGILLNSDIELSKLIVESDNMEALEKFHLYLSNMSSLSEMVYGKDPKINNAIDSLKKETDRIERELIKECQAFGDYTESMRTSWQDVQKALRPNDMAIEFISFPLIDNDDNIIDGTLYTAIFLRKNDSAPRFIVLFDEKELDRIENNDDYYEKLYHILWGTLEQYLSGISNIYFSPAGKLYNINIEVLPEIVGCNDVRNYYRVSSTKMLVHSNNLANIESDKAIVYGGINYDSPISELFSNSKSYENKDSSYRGDGNVTIRRGYDYLPGTLVEANAIASILRKAGIHTNVFTDSLGTEASFKYLDGQSSKIVHIATHGFYYSENDSIKMKEDNFDHIATLIERGSRSYKEDYSLTRSGLLMAGCNNTLRGYNIPNGIDDGILFAKEIASMNFKKVELTTLSSCDSGLGDITGDGVIGLQRAFKKAGAQTILMSLHKVDDEATRILMAEFYKNYMSGKTKHQSLKEAQQYLRKVDNGKYDNPKYWASFIMLDGLN